MIPEQDLDVAWTKLEHELLSDPQTRPLGEFLGVARRNTRIRQMFPFMSHLHICFSPTAKFPYPKDIPCVGMAGQGLYELRRTDFSLIGSGPCEEVVALVEAFIGKGKEGLMNGLQGIITLRKEYNKAEKRDMYYIVSIRPPAGAANLATTFAPGSWIAQDIHDQFKDSGWNIICVDRDNKPVNPL